ncbi:MAG: gas vesicle protein GvpJ [Candidatus Zhuqueibacterota bacterium]
MQQRSEQTHVTLLDALDRVIETGAVVTGDLTVRVADIDLIYIGIRLIATSISKLDAAHGRSGMNPDREPTLEECEYIQKLEQEIAKAESNISHYLQFPKPQEAEQGLAKLVLTLVVLIKRLMEREAMRRIQAGALASVEIQKLGLTFLALDKKVEELKLVFGLQQEELNIELGPLGNLM